MIEPWQRAGFGLYLHWPFCVTKCPYCDFNSFARKFDEGRWVEAYLVEFEQAAALTPGRVLSSIYLGGGTPSLMSPQAISRLLEAISRHWVLSNDIEITLEMNPSTVEMSKIHGFRGAGVNRVSIGVQALNDRDLKALGRNHSAGEARDALAKTRSVFENVSVDLIYARQHQSFGAWQQELNEILSFDLDHVSLYQLTIEDGTVFALRQKAGQLRGLPSENLGADMYDHTLNRLGAEGLLAYEVSNFARRGAESRHNSIYWRSGDYLGIGPGAHGRLTSDQTRWASETLRNPEIWLAAVERVGHGARERLALSREEFATEFVLMGMRMTDGIDTKDLEECTGYRVNVEELEWLRSLGVIKIDDTTVKSTDKGRLLLDRITRDMVSALQDIR